MALVDLPPRLILERLAGELTARQFDVFVMRVVDEASYQKIGTRLGISRQTAMFHYSAAVRKIGTIEWEMNQ